MLFPAYTKQKELQVKFASTTLDPYYKYYHTSYPSIGIKIDDNFWSNIQLVSLNKKEEVCGYFEAGISRPENYINSLSTVNFNKDDRGLFALDLKNFFRYLLSELNVKKIGFDVVVDNPVTKHYDSMVERLGGRVVGLKEYEYLINNKYYDMKLYEIINNHWRCNNCGYATMKTKLVCRKCGMGTMKYIKAFSTGELGGN